MPSHPRPASPLWHGLWPGLAGMAMLGSGVAVIGATHELPVLAVQSARYAVAALAIVLLARLFSVRLVAARGRDVVWVLGGGLVGLVGFNLAMLAGTPHAEPAVLGAAVACIPLVLAVVAPLARRRRPSTRLVTGALVVSAGAVAVSGWGQADALGLLMAALLIVCEAVFTLLGALALPRMGAWSFSAASTLVAALAFGLISIVVERPDPLVFVGLPAVGAVLYLGVVVTAISFVLWFTSIGRLGPGTAGLCAGVAAPAAALTGVVFGAPLPGPGAWAGMAAIGAGLAIAFLSPTRHGPRASRNRVGAAAVRTRS